MINVALPKGRLGEQVYALLADAGYSCEEILDKKTRKLVFENPEHTVRYFQVKPTDVGVYVERGAADVGIAGGKDGGALFVKGSAPRKVQGDLAEILIQEVRKIIKSEELRIKN